SSGNAVFLYNLDSTNSDFRFFSPEEFEWAVRGRSKKDTSLGEHPLTTVAPDGPDRNVSNVLVVENEPGGWKDMLHRNERPRRNDPTQASTLFLFVRSHTESAFLYVGQLWFKELLCICRQADGSKMVPPRGTRLFEILPRMSKEVWFTVGGFLWRFRVGYEIYDARTVEEMLARLELLEGDSPVAAGLTRYEDDSLIIFIAQDKAVLVYNRFEFVINPEYRGDPKLRLEDNSPFRYENGQEFECPAAAILPRRWAMSLLRDYIQSGERPAGLQWDTFDFYV
ncbi:MAG TPA: Imm1 family immunity protein, partial [Aggregatilineaceae bacterium]|nr:Imm1 family immunity protein [Aggregatilineaceae bacterium]